MEFRKKSIVFMFGAGAEKKFGLPVGNTFMKDTVFSDIICTPNEVSKALDTNKSVIHNKYFFKRIICNLMMQYINLKSLKNGGLCYNDLEEDVKKELSSIYNINKSYVEDNLGTLNINFQSGEIDSFKEYGKENSGYYSYENLKKTVDKYLGEKIKGELDSKYDDIYQSLLNNDIKISADGIDKYFISINDPKKYGVNNYSKIVNLYWSIYHKITNCCINLYADSEELLLKDAYTIDDVIKINKHIWNTNNISKVKIESDNYYKKISVINESLLNCQVYAITTNYTPFVNLIFNTETFMNNDKNIAYLNGRLDMFENFNDLSIRSCLNDQDDIVSYMKKSFPFLLAQSMLKPIIHPYQIEEYYKALTFLKDAHFLVILGYGLNEDDNHVNALLKESINENTIVIVVVADEENEQKLKKSKFFNFKEKNLEFVYFKDKADKTCEQVIKEIYEIINVLIAKEQ